MRTRSLRIAAIVVVFLAALGGALLFMRSDDGGASSSAGTGSSSAAASDIWKVGDDWTVQVRQDGGAISPDGARNVAKVPYRFTVIEAPGADNGDAWVVQVKQDGAEGPFAAGWKLFYAADGDALVLKRFAMGKERPIEAEVAAIALGSQFPYEVNYTAPPKDTTVNAADLIERTNMPPSSTPPGGADGPPKGSDLPEAPPISEAKVPSSAPATPKR